MNEFRVRNHPNRGRFLCSRGHTREAYYVLPKPGYCDVCHSPMEFLVEGKPVDLEVRGTQTEQMVQPYANFQYVFPKVRKIGPRRRPGVWARQEGRIFVTCLLCGAINDISGNRIQKDGLSECFYCTNCMGNHFIFLGGWKPPGRRNHARRYS